MPAAKTIRQQIVDAVETALTTPGGLAPLNVQRCPTEPLEDLVNNLGTTDFPALLIYVKEDAATGEYTHDSVERDLTLHLVAVDKRPDNDSPIHVALEPVLAFAYMAVMAKGSLDGLADDIEAGKIEWDFETGVVDSAAARMEFNLKYRHDRYDMTVNPQGASYV